MDTKRPSSIKNLKPLVQFQFPNISKWLVHHKKICEHLKQFETIEAIFAYICLFSQHVIQNTDLLSRLSKPRPWHCAMFQCMGDKTNSVLRRKIQNCPSSPTSRFSRNPEDPWPQLLLFSSCYLSLVCSDLQEVHDAFQPSFRNHACSLHYVALRCVACSVGNLRIDNADTQMGQVIAVVLAPGSWACVSMWERAQQDPLRFFLWLFHTLSI